MSTNDQLRSRLAEKYHTPLIIATPEAAVKRIRPGQRVFIGTGCAEPLELVSALTKARLRTADTEIVHLLTFGEAPYAHRELASISGSTVSSSRRTSATSSRRAWAITPPFFSRTSRACSTPASCRWTSR
jgi:acyl-CoA hydrolase